MTVIIWICFVGRDNLGGKPIVIVIKHWAGS